MEPEGTGPAAEGLAPDEKLTERAVAGDAGAFEALVLRYQDRIYNLLLRLTGSEADAEDLAQETFLKAYRGLSGFRRGSKFYTWLFRIAVNSGYSRGRQLVRRQRVEGASLDAGERTDNPGSAWSSSVAGRQEGDPAQQAEDEQLRERVQAGLARLEDGYRAVVLLRDVEGLDYQAIAETLEISRAAVKSRLHRARLDLARILRDLRPEGAARTVK